MTEDWQRVEFSPTASVNGVIRLGGSLVVYGSNRDGAAAWTSEGGSSWREVSRFEAPSTSKSSIEHAAARDGRLIALGDVNDGIGLWTARSATTWIYHGLIPDMDAGSLIGVAATDQVVALTGLKVGQEAWVSPDGLDWIYHGEIETLDVVVLTMEAHNGWFYAGGQRNCEEPPCPAVIYRSRDGLTWEPTDGTNPGSLSEGRGAVVDIATTSNGLLAVGHAEDRMAVWRSNDGRSWTQISSDDPVLQGRPVNVQLDGVPADDGVATLIIDDFQHRVTVGSELFTDVGLVRVVEVSEDDVGIEWADGSRSRLEPGLTWSGSLHSFAQSIVADGSRIVIAGSVGIDQDPAPAVWTSNDGGETWQARVTPEWSEGRLTQAAIGGRYITVIGGGPTGAPLVWRSTWDTSAQETTAVELVEAYFSAAQWGNTDRLLALLPSEYAGFQLPAMGGVDLEWWGEERSELSAASVATTLDYLGELNTEFRIDECTSRTVFARSGESVRVSCEFVVESDLLRTYSDAENRGTAEIIVADGALSQVRLSTAPSRLMWEMLVDGTVDAAAADRTTLARVEDGVAWLDPTFTGETAAAHLRLARDYVAGLLRPGESRIIETSLGTMEWTWMEDLPIPVGGISWITPYADRFIAVGYGNATGLGPETSLWITTDGTDWEQMEMPEGVTSLWQLQPFRDGLIGQAWYDDVPLLILYDGQAWSEIAIAAPPEGLHRNIAQMAAHADTLLVVTQDWSETGTDEPNSQAWLMGASNALVPVDLPLDLPFESGWYDQSIGIAGDAGGFLLATAGYDAQQMSIWHSPDGRTWTELAARTTLDNAAYVWNLQQHRDKYFVVGEGIETVCSDLADGSNVCTNLLSLWSSPDGQDWARVFTSSGEAVSSYEIGSGPLGLVAVGADSPWSDSQNPRPIYLSSDGEEWERAGAMNLSDPDGHWWWAQRPAVGEAVVLIPGSSYDESSGFEADAPFLIVGKLLGD